MAAHPIRFFRVPSREEYVTFMRHYYHIVDAYISYILMFVGAESEPPTPAGVRGTRPYNRMDG